MTKELPQEIESDTDISSNEDFIELYSNSDVDYQRLKGISGYYNRLRTVSADTCKHLIHVQRQQLTCITNCLVCSCKTAKIFDESQEPSHLNKNFFLRLKSHLNRDILSTLIVFIIAGNTAFMHGA